MMRTEIEARAALRTWVLGRAKDLDDETFTDSTALFEGRHLRSVHLPELLLVLERLRGAPIEVEQVSPENFSTIDAMMNLVSEPGRVS
jgi:hypothetical protein